MYGEATVVVASRVFCGARNASHKIATTRDPVAASSFFVLPQSLFVTEPEPEPEPQTQTIGGHARSAEDDERRVVRVKRKHVLLGILGVAGGLVLGALAYNWSKHYFLERKYERLAEKAVQGIGAVSDLVNTIDQSDIDFSDLSRSTREKVLDAQASN